MSNEKQIQDFKKEVEKLREIEGAEEYAKQLAHLFLGNGLSLQTILLMAIEFGQQHPAWVSMEDELPKVDEQTTLSNECVVVDSSGARYFGYYNGTDECWYTDDYTMILFVTHWMQITPPVKKGGKDEND